MTPRSLKGESVAVYLEAREVLALIGPDPDAERHWVEMGRAIGAVCKACDNPSRAGGLCDTHYRRRLRMTHEAHTINRKAAA